MRFTQSVSVLKESEYRFERCVLNDGGYGGYGEGSRFVSYCIKL